MRLPARDTNSSGDDDDDDGAVDALSPSKKRGTKMNTTTSDFQEASKGKLEKLELIFDTYHGTMIRKKRCVRGWNLSSCCIYTFDQPRSSPSWSNSNLLISTPNIPGTQGSIPEATLSDKVSSDDDNDNDNEITVDHEYPEKQRQR